ncbi:hypothetical protein [Yoonia sp. BS5-3]|uniref:Uncharacterized protein n=1 Tax=Yoonia phaeophyticola TaxID=3137369 RepID=A0ABZ2V7P9_9RHOB
MSTAPIIRLYLFFATENDTALILRRSGKKMYNLISWDRANDSFVEGQWLRKSVRYEDCALSPDGRHFIYAVHDANPDTRATGCYTVLCRAPWFTALALFPHEWGFQSGGYFLDNKLYRIKADAACKDILEQNTQVLRVVQGKVTHSCRSGLRLTNGEPAPLSRALRDQLLNNAKLPRVISLDRYETQAGCLYRTDGPKRVLIHDFTEMEPRFEPAPYGQPPKDPMKTGWHPADEAGAR